MLLGEAEILGQCGSVSLRASMAQPGRAESLFQGALEVGKRCARKRSLARGDVRGFRGVKLAGTAFLGS